MKPQRTIPFATQRRRLWSAVTCHRFLRFADLSAKQRRVQRCDAGGKHTTLTATSRLLKAVTSHRTPKRA